MKVTTFPCSTTARGFSHPTGTYHPEGGARLHKIVSSFPINLLGKPEDVANAALFLCSDEARHINGALLSVDDGMSAC